jgi:RHS repeat-associated protein
VGPQAEAQISCTNQGGDQLPDLFSLGLDYESTTNGASPQYNGNIAAMQWRTNVNGTCLTRQQYRFTYDYGNRLLTANHFTHNGTSWTNTNNYSESGIAYDLNGNIKSYTRRGLTTAPSTFGVIDQLTYTYGDAARPDRLTNVSDAGNATKGFKFTSGAAAYTYDLNGNMTQDNHKSLSISYNYLNLPSYISNTGGSDITLTYTADGEKLSKVSSAGTRNYVAGIEYLGTGLDAIYHGEGRCTPNGATAFYYEYTIKDHLGNARVNFRANGAAVTFLQELHYYPFGMLMEGIGAAQVTNNGYKYNGKELNEDLGLNWSDYGARWYDAALGRWWSVDLMGEKFTMWSGYNYGVDNPIKFIDPDGRSATDNIYRNDAGDIVAVVRTTSKTDDFYTVDNDMNVTFDESRERDASWVRLSDGEKNTVVNEVQNENDRPLNLGHVGKSDAGLSNDQTSQLVSQGMMTTTTTGASGSAPTATPANIQIVRNGTTSRYLGSYGINGEVKNVVAADPVDPSLGSNPAETAMPLPSIAPGANPARGTLVGIAATLPANMSTTVMNAGGGNRQIQTTDSNGRIVPIDSKATQWRERAWSPK